MATYSMLPPSRRIIRPAAPANTYSFPAPGRQFNPPGQQAPPSYPIGNPNDATALVGGGGYSLPSQMPQAPMPDGVIPIDPFHSGNANQMFSKGYRRKLINGQWYWVPPGNEQPSVATYF